MALRPITIFYSWQSDLPNALNRGFIEDAIERAAKDAKRSLQGSMPHVDLVPAIERDTKGRHGSPDIAGAIFEKVEACDIFVGDISVVNSPRRTGQLSSAASALAARLGLVEASRRMPNPNVMLELGYAAAKLGWNRVICVANEAFAPLDRLPFDLRGRSIVAYSLRLGGTKADVRADLVSKLKARFAPLFHDVWRDHRPPPIRFAAYADICLAVNRLLYLLLQVHTRSRLSRANDSWATVLSAAAMRETLHWASLDSVVEYAGNIKRSLGDEFIHYVEDFRQKISVCFERYGQSMEPTTYEMLHQVEHSLFIHSVRGMAAQSTSDAGSGIPRPRSLGWWVHLDEQNLGILRTLRDWCEREHAELALYDGGIRQPSPPIDPDGEPGSWRLSEGEIVAQHDAWTRWQQSQVR